MNAEKKIRKVLILGSGALQIGQAGEFDYSGGQAIKAMKQEGIKTVVMNPNIATVQTTKGFADTIYFLPLTKRFIIKVIEKEKPDGLLLSFGGQTALNCGIELHKSGVLKKYGVRILGTPIDAVIKTEDRGMFKAELEKIGVKVPRSRAVETVEDAMAVGKELGLPLMIRVAYALGGRGSDIARTQEQLSGIAEKALKHSPQILIEEYLQGWKEVEYEVVRDSFGNCITVCNMENLDPLGIHTGESIVVAPSQTLSNQDYHNLRELAIKIIRHFGIVGECNVQYALDPKTGDYRVIEVNARLSRSSALASKATGYPLAFIAAKLALGYSLVELDNSITKRTKSLFEPALDYVVVKIPRWDLQKFRRVSKHIGTEMKSVGEVMAIGRTFEEALQKGVRMLDVGMEGLVGNRIYFRELAKQLQYPTDKRIFAVVDSLKKGASIKKIFSLTYIDPWFLSKIRNIVEMEKKLAHHKRTGPNSLPKQLLLSAKKLGFSDREIARILGCDHSDIRALRERYRMFPCVKQIDTLAGEFPAKTNYLYLTYNGTEDDVTSISEAKNKKKKSALVLGSGAYRIGSSVEFDWCCVRSAETLSKLGYETIMLNYNPETVSTDYDVCDKLYFDEISLENVLEINRKERVDGIVVSMGGQIPNSLALKLDKLGLLLMGTSAKSIDSAEDRHKFSALLDKLGIKQPEWKELTNDSEALSFAKRVGYPVLVRPSYVLSGAAMHVAFDEPDLKAYLKQATSVSSEYPVVMSKFMQNAREIEIDAVADHGELFVWAFSEHIENAGVHSGDACMVLPPQKTYIETVRKMKEIAGKLASELCITGPFNIQFLAKDNDVSVIECNLRASRSFPFVSKVVNADFIELATKLMAGKKPARPGFSMMDLEHVGVKVPQFSFSRLKGADPISGVEMASTGEVGCLGADMDEALLKSLLSVGYHIPAPGKKIIVSISGDENRYKFLEELRLLSSKYELCCTEHTHIFFKGHGIRNTLIHKIQDDLRPNIKESLKRKEIDLVISVPNPAKSMDVDKNYDLRRLTVDSDVPLVTNLQLAKSFVRAFMSRDEDALEIKGWEEYF
ncbi:MAG: carbamoyl-phosphate synthase (glutamine-hydrolyzing) large subunit [Candidatus Bilamarchaeaceae archaeon]